MQRIPNKYDGGKNGSGTYQQIINLIPEHDWYFELFLGSGAILKNKLPARISFCMDKDPGLIASWNSLGLPGYIFKCSDAISFLESAVDLLNVIHDTAGRIFLYLDPPYPFFVRRSLEKLYKNELTDQDHERLLMVCSNALFPVAISSYKNSLYDQYLKGWNIHEFESMTRQGLRTECVYFNYESPEKLHDYRYIGRNFREREKMKLVKKNMVSKFNRIPAVLRNSIIQELNNKYNADKLQNTKG